MFLDLCVILFVGGGGLGLGGLCFGGNLCPRGPYTGESLSKGVSI